MSDSHKRGDQRRRLSGAFGAHEGQRVLSEGCGGHVKLEMTGGLQAGNEHSPHESQQIQRHAVRQLLAEEIEAKAFATSFDEVLGA